MKLFQKWNTCADYTLNAGPKITLVQGLCGGFQTRQSQFISLTVPSEKRLSPIMCVTVDKSRRRHAIASFVAQEFSRIVSANQGVRNRAELRRQVTKTKRCSVESHASSRIMIITPLAPEQGQKFTRTDFASCTRVASSS